MNASDLLGVPASRSSSTHKGRIYGRGRDSPAQAKTEDPASPHHALSLLQSRRPNGLQTPVGRGPQLRLALTGSSFEDRHTASGVALVGPGPPAHKAVRIIIELLEINTA